MNATTPLIERTTRLERTARELDAARTAQAYGPWPPTAGTRARVELAERAAEDARRSRD